MQAVKETTTLRNDVEMPLIGQDIRAIGLSNFESDRLEEVIAAAQIKPAVLQVELHPYFQQNPLKERVAPYSTVLEAWYPLGHSDSGLLNEPLFTWLAEKYGKTSVQIILRWHIQEGTIIFPKSTNPQHIKDNFNISDFELTGEEIAQIRALVWLSFPIMELLRFGLAVFFVSRTYTSKLAVLRSQAA